MEIEIKAQVDDLAPIRRKLKKIGAKKTKFVHQMDEYYSLYKRPYTKKDRGDIVRVRYPHGELQGRLEYHSSKNKYAAEEYEVAVANVRELKKILRKMKAKREAIVNKRREYYRKGRIEITLDQVKGLGTFVEVEIQGNDTQKNRQAIHDMFSRLGISWDQYCFDLRYGAAMLQKKGKKYAYF